MEKYILHITIQDRMIEYPLPAVDNRKGNVDLCSATGIKDFRLSYEVWDGEWHLLSNEYVRLSQDHRVTEDKRISDGDIFSGKIYKSEVRFFLNVRRLSKEASAFEKYVIQGLPKVQIGSNNGCQIVLNDKYVSSIHAVLICRGTQWYIQDCSTNGIYVNKKRVGRECRLNEGDCIYIMGYTLMFLSTFLAINRADKTFVRFQKLDPKESRRKKVFADESMFSRNPRILQPLDKTEMEVEGPPQMNIPGKTSLLFILGPSLTMPLPILATMLFNMATNSRGESRASTYIGMGISVIMFAGLGVMWSLLRNRYDKERQEEAEEQRVFSYQLYIAQNDEAISAKQVHNRNLLLQQFPGTPALIEEMSHSKFGLWNRNINHPDYLHIRLGIGSMESPNPLKVPKGRFSVVQDAMTQLPQNLVENYKDLQEVPWLFDLRSTKMLGVIGDAAVIGEIVNSMIIQIAALHAYTEVKMVFFSKEFDEKYDLNWTRWLPHTFSDDKKIRYIAKGENEYQNILYTLTNEIRMRKEETKEGLRKTGYKTHYIVFSTDKGSLENEILYRYMVDEQDYGITFILLHNYMDALPNGCKYILEATALFQGVYSLEEERTNRNLIRFERIDSVRAERFARKLTGITISEVTEGAIPEAIDYFSLLGIRTIEEWNIGKKYKENRSYEGIKALVGVSGGNKPMFLDIHEKKHGPHGLVAGTTGSGKSETIQTFIISLALHYHPDEVSFILIDYKGGGMANAFKGLPHLAGTITNLGEQEDESESVDANQTRRALISIRSEIKRRQGIFNTYNVNQIDAYMRLYRQGKTAEALPHLIIISDEFAELKKEQPEFIKELVSAARVGRSLGIHLILATQKPAGVVDDEIWSNSRFKLCLRVQDKADSQGMLHRPEAAFLTTTGRAYLQIGNDEIFEQFQSGYSGAPYIRYGEGEEPEEEITMIELDGTPAIVKSKGRTDTDKAVSQLDTAVHYIVAESRRRSIGTTRPLWLPPLPTHIVLAEIAEPQRPERGGRRAVLGLVDQPEQQRQYPLVIDLVSLNNLLIVGNSGCGKSTLLQTMLVSLLGRYGPEEFQFYVLDFSTQGFKKFPAAPQCGGMLLPDEQEKIHRLFAMILDMMEERKKVFAEVGIGTFAEYEKMYKDLPFVSLILDNYFDFNEAYPDLDDSFMKMIRDAAKFGIQIVVTINRLMDMRYKLRQIFTKVLPIQLPERSDYLEVFGKSPEFIPLPRQGRGLVADGDILEYQIALPSQGENEAERSASLTKFIAALSKRYPQGLAKMIPCIPQEEVFSAFYLKHREETTGKKMLPMGYEKRDIQITGINLFTDYCMSIGGAKRASIMNYMNNLLFAVNQEKLEIHLVKLHQEMTALSEEGTDAVYRDAQGIHALLMYLAQVFKDRSDEWKAYCGQSPNTDVRGYSDEHFPKIFVLIDDIEAFMEIVYKNTEYGQMYTYVEQYFDKGSYRGIYFVAGFPADMQAQTHFMEATKLFKKYNYKIHFGGRMNQQKLLEVQLPLKEQVKEWPYNEGYMEQGGRLLTIYCPENEKKEE